MDRTTRKITNQRVAFKQKKFVSTNWIEYILLSLDKGGQSSNLKKTSQTSFVFYENWIEYILLSLDKRGQSSNLKKTSQTSFF